VARAFLETWESPPDFTKPRADLGGLTLDELSAIAFEDLGQFKAAGKFPPGYGLGALTFYAPRDPGVHQVIIWTLLQATHSVAVNMYGFDDQQAAAIIKLHTLNGDIAVTLSLDSSQAAGRAEAPILASFNNDLIGNSIAIGRSSRGDISHDKLLVVDGQYLVTGSTNWSQSGEELQDNQLTLSRDPLAAAEARSIIDLDHDDMLKQMAAKAAEAASKTASKLAAANRKLKAATTTR
jgi:phosphatidylserine/phosphatidylglycerophosphate/cardiolipin synthase-like enzyme